MIRRLRNIASLLTDKLLFSGSDPALTMGNLKKEVKNSKGHKLTKPTAAKDAKLLDCKQCPKKFSDDKNLQNHIHAAHESSKEFQVGI